MKYSKLQHFFWLISGSEISVLKECENEYNRHTNIGMMILITSLFAFFTAFIAGITFARENLLGIMGVIVFATSWALLIFAIDRSMVNSIKRVPDAHSQPFWSFFIPRFILAVILAFFMSIPLDHIVFSEAIERQRLINIHNEWLDRQEGLDKGYDVAVRDSGLKTMEEEIKGLEDELKSDCPLPNYSDAINNYNDCKSTLIQLKTDYENKKLAASKYFNQLPIDRNTGRRITNSIYSALRNARDEANNSWKNKEKECNGYYDEAKKIDSDWRAGKQTEINEKNSQRKKDQDKLSTDKNTARDEAEAFKKDLAGMTGFDTKFTTLFLMPNWGVQVLKWAIFLALLIIEILPTYLKLKTPVGQYDRKMQEREDIMKNDIEERVSSEKNITRQTEAHRVDEEVKLNKAIIDKIASVELKLAQETLDEWEQEARMQSKKNVHDSVSQNKTL